MMGEPVIVTSTHAVTGALTPLQTSPRAVYLGHVAH